MTPSHPKSQWGHPGAIFLNLRSCRVRPIEKFPLFELAHGVFEAADLASQCQSKGKQLSFKMCKDMQRIFNSAMIVCNNKCVHMQPQYRCSSTKPFIAMALQVSKIVMRSMQPFLTVKCTNSTSSSIDLGRPLTKTTNRRQTQDKPQNTNFFRETSFRASGNQKNNPACNNSLEGIGNA